ncbi:hypothetical protein GJAV_G00122900 [Gymnothorax javanicus]|nr:hypothetical protein GJAV_G00122900 [Gymnothorax javanicus]
MVCRNWGRAEETRAEIFRETGNKKVYVHLLDISETQRVWEFAEYFRRRYRCLNVLNNNAGCMVLKREVTSEGFERNFATKTLGVYILTQGLLPLLERSRAPRVITVTSGGMLVQKLRTTDLQSELGHFDAAMVYAQNKRQQVVRTQMWAGGYPGIHFSAAHPGWADTPATALPQLHISGAGDQQECLNKPNLSKL